MAEFAVVRLSHDEARTQWMRVDSDGSQLSHVTAGTLQSIADEIAGLPVIALLPATDVLTTSVNLPIKSAAKIRAALPFALEESLAEDVETLHFAAGSKQAGGEIPVAVIADSSLTLWLERLASVNIRPLRVVAENHGLAKIPGTMSVLADRDCVMFNDGSVTEFAMQDVKPSDMLVAAGHLGESGPDAEGDEDPDKLRHLLVFSTESENERLAHDWTALRHELVSVEVTVLPDGALPKLASAVARGAGVNLLQGAYGPKTEYAALFRPWRRVAALLAVLCGVLLVGKGADYYRLVDERDQLQAQFNSEYQRLQPGANGDVADPLGIARMLRARYATTDVPQVFLPSIQIIGEAIAAGEDTDIEAISYRAGVVDIRLSAPDVSRLDAIQKAVSESGRFQATIQSTDQVADRINGRIQVREPRT